VKSKGDTVALLSPRLVLIYRWLITTPPLFVKIASRCDTSWYNSPQEIGHARLDWGRDGRSIY